MKAPHTALAPTDAHHDCLPFRQLYPPPPPRSIRQGRSRSFSAPPSREPSPCPVASGETTGALSHNAQGSLSDSPESAARSTTSNVLGVQLQPSVRVQPAAASARDSSSSSTEGASVASRDGPSGDTRDHIPDKDVSLLGEKTLNT